MTMTDAQVLALLRQHFPEGGEVALDLDDEEGFGAILGWVAEQLNVSAQAPADALAAEVTPMTATGDGRLPELEKALALTETAIAHYGSDVARRAQMLSRLRERGTPRIAFIKAALAAVCGYAPDIIEHSRAAVTQANKVALPTGIVGPLSSVNFTMHLADNAPASLAGAQLAMALDIVDPSVIAITLTPPSGPVLFIDPARWPAATMRITPWPDYAGRSITGTWTLTIGNGDVANSVEVKPGGYLLVEGIGRDAQGRDGLGARIFEWSAAIDESRITPATYDREVVIGIVRRFNPAHELGGVALYQTDGTLCALADDPNCIDDLCVAC